MAGFFSKYQSFLKEFPVLTQALQCSVLVGTGDVIAQTLIEKKTFNDYSFRRTCQFASVGLFIVGPILTKWYGVLDRYIGSKTKSAVLKKVACDQLLFAPCFTGVFLTSLGFAQKKEIKEIQRSIQKNYGDILITNYKIWPATQLLNFYLTPLQYQVLVVQFVALFWNTYLSIKTQQN